MAVSRRSPPPTVLAGPPRTLPARSIVELVHRVVQASPDAVAIEHSGRRWRFGRFWDRSMTVAGALRGAGVEPGQRVAVWATRSMDTIATTMAIMAVRASYVPIDPAYPAARVRAMADQADLALLTYDSRTAAGPPPPLGVRTFDVATIAGTVRDTPIGPGPHADDIAYVVFTSGSTGLPRGVRIEHRSLVNYSMWCGAVAGGGGHGSPLFGNLGFDHSITSWWPVLAHGQRIVLAGGVWDEDVLFARRRERYSFLKITPSHVRFLERTIRPSYRDHVELLIFGGEPLPTSLVSSLDERVAGRRLINHYGPTETTVGCCYHEFDAGRMPALPTVPIGRPIWNTRAYLVDDNLAPVRSGQPAELVVAGTGVAAGYLERSTVVDRFIDESEVGGPAGRAYRTGDIVELLADGNLLHLGRKDNQVKINGYRMELGELHRRALAVDGVADVAFDLDTGEGRGVVALVVPEADDLDRRALAGSVRRALAAALPAAVVPRQVQVVPELVLSPHGKIDIAATRRLAEPQ